jgi:hypothetical protein
MRNGISLLGNGRAAYRLRSWARVVTAAAALASLLLVVGLVPGLAFAQSGLTNFGVKQETYEVPPGMVGKHNGECKRLTRMIHHYADVADMAKERGDDAWREGMIDHIAHLTERRAQLCPTLYAQKPIGPELAKMLKGAAQIALKLFTMGVI